MLTPETVLQGRYRIVRQLGQGGMGAVYEAVDERLDTTIALKETLFGDERLRKQFEREARLLARMHHPALPRVSDHFSEAEGQFLVMQFIAGEDLAEMIARRRAPFPSHQVLTWADQLLDALDYLHTQDPQIIHRDIKPQNLKLTSRGQIILLDFGLAKGQASEVSRVTTSASIFGYTPNYAPLEQIQGLGTDARSDIYALGATLYHLVTNAKPPDALTRAAAFVNGQPDPLKPAHEGNHAVAPAFAAVLQRAMAQNRDQRYANAAEMRRAFQGGESATTVPVRSEAATVLFPTSAPTVSPEARMNAMQATVPAAGAELTQALPTGETTMVHRPEKSRTVPWAIAAAMVVLLLGAGGFYAYQRRHNSATVNAPVASPAANEPAGAIVDQSQPTGSDSGASTISEEKKNVAADKQQVAAEERAVKKQEKATTREKATTTKPSGDNSADTGGDAERVQEHPQQAPPDPDLPNDKPPDAPKIERPRGTTRAGGVQVRNFPDGSQLIIAPDGSRVLIRPDGTKQFFRSTRRTDRRKPLPQP